MKISKKAVTNGLPVTAQLCAIAQQMELFVNTDIVIFTQMSRSL
jgi:hypothetical protein